MVMFK